MFGRLGWCSIYTFSGDIAPGRNFAGAKFTLRPSLAFCILALHGTPAAGVSKTLRRGTRLGITELSQRASAIQKLAKTV